MSVRVRYAPSPTGFLHIGNARTALFNYLFAKKNNGSFIVRIEDTDTQRNVAGGEVSQLNYLKWLGVDWDESVDKDGGYGPYRQLDRLDIYKKYAEELLDRGLAYKCYCTQEELASEREELMNKGASNIHYSRKCLNSPPQNKPYTIRFKVPENKEYIFDDIVRGSLSFKSEDIGDWVIMKNNGIPTYNFACVIDDHLMEISHVLRGEDHITNTPKQMMIYDSFVWDIPTFGHMTLIVNEQNKKLSKRDSSIIQFIEQYMELGYLPEALFNFIGLLGWSPLGEEEILTKEDFINLFDEKRLSKSSAKFDSVKLTYINNRYVKELPINEVVELCKPHLLKEGIIENKEDDWIEKLVSVFHDRLSYGEEIIDLYDEFFNDDFDVIGEELDFLHQDGVIDTIKALRGLLEDITEWNFEEIKKVIKQTGKNASVKGKMLFMPCRIATTASMHGPDLPKVLELLGKEVVLQRLNAIIDKL